MMEELILRQLSFDDLLDTPTIDLHKKHIAITGYLDFKRNLVIEWITDCGGLYCTTVSANTDYLVVGRIRRTKNMKSEETRKLHNAHLLLSSGCHIKILSPEDLYRALEGSIVS